ncbi:hypothetical protein OS493_017911 [Desmophyllum pertusum]|uniref:Uncharacterized protein n=1 Tax=Desmophyllum pertusum TaxID=174260 RepID=A0A9W9Z092_9CNID|nr:hypothetical protein OS493_017911 [Desmophyllum pertusum]
MKNRGELGSQTAQEPLLLTRKLNRRLSVQNNQLTSNWEKVRESLDKIQGFAKSKMERDQSEMLKYQEKLKGNSSGSFQSAETTAVSTVTTPRTRSMSFSVEHEEAMKQIWLDKAEKSRQRRFSFSNESSAQIATISSEKKRVFRRRASLSLLDLQKMNEGINGKLRVSEASKTFLNPLEEEPSSCSSRRSSVFDTNDEDEPIRVPPSGVRFPPIHQLQPAKLASRSFEKDLDFVRKTSGELNDIDDLKYCRYLRVQSRRKSIA